MMMLLILINIIGLIFVSAYIGLYLNLDSQSDNPIGAYKIIFKYGICYPVQIFKLANSTYNVVGSAILTILSLVVSPAFAFVSILLLIIISVLFGFNLIFKRKDNEE